MNKLINHSALSESKGVTGEERISWQYVVKEIIHFFTHIEERFLHTSWQMIIRPGETVIDFIAGRRHRYQSPVSYFLVWTTICGLSFFLVEKYFGPNVVIKYGAYFGPGTRIALSHLGFVLTIPIPVQALFLYLLMTRQLYNYFEVITAVIFAIGTVIVFQFVFVLLALVYHLLTGQTAALFWSDGFKIIYLTWFIISFAKQLHFSHKPIKSLAFLILAFGFFTLWRLIGLPVLMK